jgi:hypothetical protein
MIRHECGHDAATSRLSSYDDAPPGLFLAGVLAGAAQKGHSRLNLGGSREIRAASA